MKTKRYGYTPFIIVLMIVSLTLACSLQTSAGRIPTNNPTATLPSFAPTSVLQGGPVPNTGATLSPEATANVGQLNLPTSAADGQVPPAALTSNLLENLYNQVNPGVVNIQDFVQSSQGLGQAAGSGFILDNDGHILTNNHVIADATDISVTFFDGTASTATVVGADPDSDLAVLKVQSIPKGTHPLPLGDSSKVKVGEWVIAIGNPFAIGTSMSQGIVSAVGRVISGLTQFSIPEVIQTDAAINPGNSGGPLLNLSGEVIGVNAQIASNSSTSPSNSGVGFAIPSNIVKRVAPSLITKGSMQWPWLGVEGGSLNLLTMQANHLSTQQGAYIQAITPGSPAEQAGLHGATSTVDMNGITVPVGGDVVIAADGTPIRNFSDLLAEISQKNPGDQIQLTILRNGQQQQVTVKLAPRPANVPQQNTAP